MQSIHEYRHTPWVAGKATDPDGDITEPQSHGGDLLEHSVWTWQQTMAWLHEGNVLARGANARLAVAAALLHDIGKGGDCIQSCLASNCFFDLYAKEKYEHRDDRMHHEVGAEMIMGERPYYTTCACGAGTESCKGEKTLNIHRILNELGVLDLRNEVAMVVAMHWEFGTINIPSETALADRYTAYVDTFINVCRTFEVRPTLRLLCTCILVSCADISAGTGVRLRASGLFNRVPDDIYPSRDPWVAYDMVSKAPKYREGVIEAFVRRLQHVRSATPRGITTTSRVNPSRTSTRFA